MSRIFINSRGEICDVVRPHIAEQVVNDQLSVLYFDNPEDRALLEGAATALGDTEIAAFSRGVIGCQLSGSSCIKEECLGKCVYQPGPFFKTCKCEKNKDP